MFLRLPEDFFRACLSPTDSATPVRLHAGVCDAAGGAYVEAFESLDVEKFEELERCKLEVLEVPRPIAVSTWGGPDQDRIVSNIQQGHYRVEWRGETLAMVVARWKLGWSDESRTWLVGRNQEVVRAFALDVARVTNDPGDAILVFHGACWQRSHELYKAVQQASFEDLILPGALKDQIRGDFRRFLGARADYEALDVPWRRGALFVGPPGNGKTMCLRALVRELGVPALYVQSVKHKYETEEANLKRVFERARQLRPCVLVLEDLDALITRGNRSFFLNQLDGFEKNVGLIVVATTNHPERIDPAIVDRPSRFDRTYRFGLPELAERRAYLDRWHVRLVKKTGWSPESVSTLADATAGFSFAYLKELVVSSLTKLVAGEAPFDAIIAKERDTLEAQMAARGNATALSGDAPTDLADDVDDV